MGCDFLQVDNPNRSTPLEVREFIFYLGALLVNKPCTLYKEK